VGTTVALLLPVKQRAAAPPACCCLQRASGLRATLLGLTLSPEQVQPSGCPAAVSCCTKAAWTFSAAADTPAPGTLLLPTPPAGGSGAHHHTGGWEATACVSETGTVGASLLLRDRAWCVNECACPVCLVVCPVCLCCPGTGLHPQEQCDGGFSVTACGHRGGHAPVRRDRQVLSHNLWRLRQPPWCVFQHHRHCHPAHATHVATPPAHPRAQSCVCPARVSPVPVHPTAASPSRCSALVCKHMRARSAVSTGA
jgi:hypothetical protein